MKFSVFVTLLLTGCANLTASELRETKPFVYTVASAPEAVARCIGANAEAISGEYAADVRGREVIIRVVGAVSAVAVVTPASAGSTAEIFIGPAFPKSKFAEAYIKGC